MASADAVKAIERLPPMLRERFDTDAGRREMKKALEDKALLVAEARRRKLDQTESVRRDVAALEERLILQALLKEEMSTLQTDEAAQRQFWTENPALFSEPERVRVGRAFVAVRNEGTRTTALGKAEALRKRLIAGEALAEVSRDGDGAERLRGGDIGFVRADDKDQALSKAAFALDKPGQVSQPVLTAGGFSVLVLIERAPARIKPFDEARGEVMNHMQPLLERRAFEALLRKARATGGAG